MLSPAAGIGYVHIMFDLPASLFLLSNDPCPLYIHPPPYLSELPKYEDLEGNEEEKESSGIKWNRMEDSKEL